MSISAPSGVSACCNNWNTGVLEGMTYIAGLRRRLVRLSWVGIGAVRGDFDEAKRSARSPSHYNQNFETIISYFHNTVNVSSEPLCPRCRATRRFGALVVVLREVGRRHFVEPSSLSPSRG